MVILQPAQETGRRLSARSCVKADLLFTFLEDSRLPVAISLLSSFNVMCHMKVIAYTLSKGVRENPRSDLLVRLGFIKCQ